jgi:hypothetical protein
MMDAHEQFYQLLRRDFSPLLRAESYKESGITFRRHKDDVIHVLNIQGSRYGGQGMLSHQRPVQVSFGGRQRASVPSTEAATGTCGAPVLAASSLTASPSDAGWFGLAGSPLHSGCDVRP